MSYKFLVVTSRFWIKATDEYVNENVFVVTKETALRKLRKTKYIRSVNVNLL